MIVVAVVDGVGVELYIVGCMCLLFRISSIMLHFSEQSIRGVDEYALGSRSSVSCRRVCFVCSLYGSDLCYRVVPPLTGRSGD